MIQVTRVYGRECILCVVLEVLNDMSERTASSFKSGDLENPFCFLVSYVSVSPFLLAAIRLYSYSPNHDTNRPFIFVTTSVKLSHIKKSTNLTFRGTCIVTYSYNKSQRDALFLIFI